MNRREFMGISVAALLAGALPASAQKARQAGMYPALNGVLINGRVGWPAFAELAANTGYPGVDVDFGPTMKDGMEKTRELLARLNLKPAVFSFPVEFRKDDEAFRRGMEKLEERARFAAALGCPRMVTWILPSSDRPKADQRKLYKDRFSEAAKVLAGSGVRLGLEFIGPLHLRKQSPHEFIWRMDEMTEFARECGPNVGLLLDVWHWQTAGATAKDIVAAGKDRIVHIHLSDVPNIPPEQIRDNQRLLPGEGVVDWKAFLGTLKKIGYKDAMSVEVFSRMNDATPEEAARKGLETTQAVMKKAGV